MVAVGASPVEEYGPRWVAPPFERGTDGPRVILVGVDGSDTSMRAAAYACGLARRQRCRLVVAYAAPVLSWLWAVPGAVPLLLATHHEVAHELRAEIRQLAEEMRIPVCFVTRHGDPYGCLRQVAGEVKADIVVVGASAGTHRLFGGSVASRLVRLGRWPVTVVP